MRTVCASAAAAPRSSRPATRTVAAARPGRAGRRERSRSRARAGAAEGWESDWEEPPLDARGALMAAPWLSALGSRLSALGSRLSALGSRLSALGSRLSALGSRLSALGSRLSALGSRLSALGSRLSAMILCATSPSHCQALNSMFSPLFRGLPVPFWLRQTVPSGRR